MAELYTSHRHFIRVLFILTIVFLTTSFGNVSADVNSQSFCASIETVEKDLGNLYGELPFIEAESTSGHKTIIFLNKKTKSYTIVHSTDDIACVIDVGENLRPILPGKKI